VRSPAFASENHSAMRRLSDRTSRRNANESWSNGSLSKYIFRVCCGVYGRFDRFADGVQLPAAMNSLSWLNLSLSLERIVASAEFTARWNKSRRRRRKSSETGRRRLDRMACGAGAPPRRRQIGPAGRTLRRSVAPVLHSFWAPPPSSEEAIGVDVDHNPNRRWRLHARAPGGEEPLQVYRT
jgi:hypothetical protein